MTTEAESNEPSWLTAVCPHCAGAVEFPAEGAGTPVDCPHCGAPFELVATEEPGARTPASSPSGLGLADLLAAFPRDVPRRRASLAYQARLALACMMVLALPAAYLALVGGVAWGTASFARHWLSWFRGFVGDPAFAPVGAALHVLGLFAGAFLVAFLVKPFFARRRTRSSALALNPGAEPLVVTFVGLVCDALGAAHPVRIEVDGRTNASAGFRGGWLGWLRGERVVTLGLPLVAVLDTRQFAGVLAHEFGHFNQGFAFRASHLVRALNAWLSRIAYDPDAWDAVLDRWQAAGRPGPGRIFVALARLGVGLSRAVLKILVRLGHAASCSLLREMEYQADRAQIDLAGTRAFEQTAETVQLLREVARERYRLLRTRWDEGAALPDHLPAVVARDLARLAPEQRSRILDRARRAERRPFETHPSVAERQSRARRIDAPGQVALDLPAAALFSDFDTLARQVTLLHYLEVLRLPRGRLRVAPDPGTGTAGDVDASGASTAGAGDDPPGAV